MNAPGFLDSLVPQYDARERHEVIISAPTSTVYATLNTIELASPWLVRVLLALRTLPSQFGSRRRGSRSRQTGAGVRSLLDAGFGLIAEEPGSEIVLGLGGTFWQLRPSTYPLTEEGVRQGPRPGSAVALWNFRVDPLPRGRTLLSTETRVLTGDRRSHRRFRLYWLAVRPFSGLIRRAMLHAVRRAAEREHRHTGSG